MCYFGAWAERDNVNVLRDFRSKTVHFHYILASETNIGPEGRQRFMEPTVEELKQAAGIAAAAYVKDGMKVGLGTGSTVKHTIIELGRRVSEGLQIIGVPTSVETENLALELDIPLADLGSMNGLDIVIDGTDEFDPQFNLIKGGGGALLREKIVAQAAASMIVVADPSKEVEVLGAFSLPIEVTQFSWTETKRQIQNMFECEARIRGGEEEPFVTDNGNYILDLQCGPTLNDSLSAEARLLSLAGVCEVGLFNNICDIVIVASEHGIETLHKPGHE